MPALGLSLGLPFAQVTEPPGAVYFHFEDDEPFEFEDGELKEFN